MASHATHATLAKREKVRAIARRRLRSGVSINQLVKLADCSRELARTVLDELLDAGEARMHIRSSRNGGNRWSLAS